MAYFSADGTQLPVSFSCKVGFEVPHLVISTVDGRFGTFTGDIVVDTASVDTGVKQRDEHLRSPDFFDTAKFPQMKFVSTGIRGSADAFQMTGDLTIKGVTKKVTFDGKFLGTAKDTHGQEKAAFSATTKINRKDFGLAWSKVVEVGPVVGDDVTIELRIQGARAAK